MNFARQALGDRVAEEEVGHGLGPRGDVEDLERARAGEVAAGHVADGVAAGLAAREADGPEQPEHVRDVAELDEVELGVLAGRQVAPAAGVLGGDRPEDLELLGGDPAVGDLHPHHLVGAALALAVDALVEPHHPEDVLREVAREVLLDRGLEMVDLVGHLGIEGAGSQRFEVDGHGGSSAGRGLAPDRAARGASAPGRGPREGGARSGATQARAPTQLVRHLVGGAALSDARGSVGPDHVQESNDSVPEMPVFWSGINPTGLVEVHAEPVVPGSGPKSHRSSGPPR